MACEGQFLLCRSYLFIWRIHSITWSDGSWKMNGPALPFITFIQTHQPVYLLALTWSPSGNCISHFFSLCEWNFVSWHIFTELIRHFCHHSLLATAVLKPNSVLSQIYGFSVFLLLENRQRNSSWEHCEIHLAPTERHVRSPLIKGDILSFPLTNANLQALD